MKVVLVNLPQMMPVSWKAPEIFQPTGLAYLAAYLEAHGVDVKIIDGNLGELVQQCDYYYSGVPIRELSRQIRTSNPDLVGISVLFSLTAKTGIELAKHLKCWDHDIPIVIGGAHPTVRPIEMLRARVIDFVVLGEGEHALLNLVTMLEQGLLPDSEGLAWMDGSVPEVHPIEEFISDLDSLPFPARHLLDMKAYFEAHDKGRSIPTPDRHWSQMITSRGCPYKCIFCSIQPTHGRRFRPRSPENVVDEMEHLMDKYGVRFVNIEDDNVALSTKRFENICDLIMERDLDLQWANSNGMRADQITPEIAKKIVKAGCQSVQISPESGCQEVVTNIIKKQMDLETVPKAIKALREAGMGKIYSSFVIGLPGETKEQIWQTLQYGKNLKKMGSEIWFNIAVPFHGTPLYKIAFEAGYLNDQFNDMLGTWRGTMDTDEWTGDEIEEFQQLGIWYGRSTRNKLRFLARLALGLRFREFWEKLRWMRISDVKDFSCRYSC